MYLAISFQESLGGSFNQGDATATASSEPILKSAHLIASARELLVLFYCFWLTMSFSFKDPRFISVSGFGSGGPH